MISSLPPVRAEGVQHPSLKTWSLRGLLAFAVIGICASLAIVGWMAYIRIKADTGDQAAIDHWEGKIVPNLPLLVGGIALGGAIGVGSYWGYRRLQRKVVAEAKVKLIKLVLKGKLTEGEAADKLGVDKPEIRNAIKELEEEGVIEE